MFLTKSYENRLISHRVIPKIKGNARSSVEAERCFALRMHAVFMRLILNISSEPALCSRAPTRRYAADAVGLLLIFSLPIRGIMPNLLALHQTV